MSNDGLLWTGGRPANSNERIVSIVNALQQTKFTKRPLKFESTTFPLIGPLEPIASLAKQTDRRSILEHTPTLPGRFQPKHCSYQMSTFHMNMQKINRMNKHRFAPACNGSLPTSLLPVEKAIKFTWLPHCDVSLVTRLLGRRYTQKFQIRCSKLEQRLLKAPSWTLTVRASDVYHKLWSTTCL